MNVLNFSENLIALRHEKQMTQEELADFLGVTKAAISKWENKQSLPDILLLPKLACFFDVTVDELLGYEMQLSREQIQKLYQELCKDFAVLPLEQVLDKLGVLVKRYYSCYPFLLQAVILYMNHVNLAKEEKQQHKMLEEGVSICERIIRQCSEVELAEDAMALKAMLQLQLGRTEEVIAMLEPLTDPFRLSRQYDSILIQAYQASGELEKAGSFNQISMYLSLLSLVGGAVQYLVLHMDNLKVCEQTIDRILGVFTAFSFLKLHPNMAAQFYYQAAMVYAVNGKQEETLDMLRNYQAAIEELFGEENITLHGDEYFDCIQEWIAKLPLGEKMPRSMELAAESSVAALNHPAFELVWNTREMEEIQEAVKRAVHYQERNEKG